MKKKKEPGVCAQDEKEEIGVGEDGGVRNGEQHFPSYQMNKNLFINHV